MSDVPGYVLEGFEQVLAETVGIAAATRESLWQTFCRLEDGRPPREAQEGFRHLLGSLPWRWRWLDEWAAKFDATDHWPSLRRGYGLALGREIPPVAVTRVDTALYRLSVPELRQVARGLGLALPAGRGKAAQVGVLEPHLDLGGALTLGPPRLPVRGEPDPEAAAGEAAYLLWITCMRRAYAARDRAKPPPPGWGRMAVTSEPGDGAAFHAAPYVEAFNAGRQDAWPPFFPGDPTLVRWELPAEQQARLAGSVSG